MPFTPQGWVDPPVFRPPSKWERWKVPALITAGVVVTVGVVGTVVITGVVGRIWTGLVYELNNITTQQWKWIGLVAAIWMMLNRLESIATQIGRLVDGVQTTNCKLADVERAVNNLASDVLRVGRGK